MIARMWRGWSPSWEADAVAAQLFRAATQRYRDVPGNRGAYLLRRGDGERTEFAVLSLWESPAAVTATVGDLESASRAGVVTPRMPSFTAVVAPRGRLTGTETEKGRHI